MTFTASNGIRLNVIADGQAEIVYPRRGNDSRSLVTWARPEEMIALREFFAHEAELAAKPWMGAERGDVWLFRAEGGNGRALAWRAADSWDVIDQVGNFHCRIQDVPAEMLAHAFYGWENPTAERIYRLGDAS